MLIVDDPFPIIPLIALVTTVLPVTRDTPVMELFPVRVADVDAPLVGLNIPPDVVAFDPETLLVVTPDELAPLVALD